VVYESRLELAKSQSSFQTSPRLGKAANPETIHFVSGNSAATASCEALGLIGSSYSSRAASKSAESAGRRSMIG
jgi:hypothetical protein